MIREVPGTNWSAPGREFLYIEILPGEDFRTVIDQAVASATCKPPAGGVGEEKVRVRRKNGKWLLGLSYRGDVQGWRTVLQAFCEQNERLWAVPSKETLTLSDETTLSWSECDIVFER